MSGKFNRRKMMKGLGGTAIGMAATTTVSAEDDPKEALAESEQIKQLLNAVGNPEIESVEKKEHRHHDKNSVITTRAETEIGELVYGELDRSNDGVFSSYFEVDSSSKSEDLPKQYRSSPNDTEIILVNEDSEGVQTYRTATSEELSILAEITGSNPDEISASYKKEFNAFEVTNQTEEVLTYVSIVGNSDTYLQRQAISPLRSERYEVDEISKQDVSTQGDGCFALFGPCPSCAVGGVTCAGCAGACVTGPQCSLCLVATCGYAGGSCGCCLICIDNVPDDGNVVCG
ncbi:hypothetical protein [Natrinema marinum]|uniref:hypothetical protein n=1 Tax=Natrinema marinum TaxID=2961598 RepID=UPI0020C8B5CA|nr:hypothetical protein [Natrinema marinum]